MREKTHAEKALSGTVRLDRTGTKRAKVVTTNKIPPAQRHLTRRAKKIYKDISIHLIKHNALATIDSFYVSGVAQHYDVYQTMMERIVDAENKIPGTGYFKTHASGATQISDEQVIANKNWEMFTKGCDALGLNLRARDKIIAFAKDSQESEKKDPFAEMIARKQQRQAGP